MLVSISWGSLMSRLKRLRPEELTSEQSVLYDGIVGGPRGQGPQLFALMDSEGSLNGPYNAFLYAPALGNALQQLGAAVRYGSSLSPRMREAAILVVGYLWRSDFEIYAHEAIGRSVGLSGDELASLRAGAIAPSFAEDEAAAIRVCNALARGDIGDDLWDAAVEELGTETIVELTTLVGYYAALALQLRVFRVGVDAESDGETGSDGVAFPPRPRETHG